MVQSSEATFLKALFRELNGKGIVYAVARQMPSLPESLGGGDLDLMTTSVAELKKLVAVVSDVAKQHNGGFTTIFKGDYASIRTARAYIASLAGRYDDGVWWGLHIDMYVGADFHGLPYMATEMLMAQRGLVEGCYYCLGSLSDISNFVKEILHNGRMKKNYFVLARDAYSHDAEAARNALMPYFGKDVTYIEALLRNRNEKDSFADARRKLRRRLVMNSGVLKVLAQRGANFIRRAMRFLSPPGFFVAVLGTDGSGKSTLIHAVTPFIERMTHLKVEYHHLRPGWMPSLSRLAGRPQKCGPVTAPHEGKPAGRISSLLRFFYYWIDYTVGYLVNVHLAKAKHSAVIVGDRWYYEYVIDPRRCAVQLPKWMPRLFSHLIPSPDLIICLGGAPEKIYARKPETSIEEVGRQVVALKKFCDDNRRAIWIDTTGRIEESSNEMLGAILAAMECRCK